MEKIRCPKCGKVLGEVANLELAKVAGFKLKIQCRNSKCKHMYES